jgi:hypothetical protein
MVHQIGFVSLTSMLLSSLVFASLLYSQTVYCASPDISIGFRARLETADIAEQHAHALTVKARITATQTFKNDFLASLEFDHIASLSADKHSNGVDQTNYPTIADPKGTEINQAKVQTDWLDSTITLGRQEIVFDGQRFIGDLGFRQNDQTYDALRVDTQVLSGSKLSLAYIHNVNRIFGNNAEKKLSVKDTRFAALNGIRPSSLLGNHHLDAFVYRLNINEWDHVELTSYGMLIHNYDAADLSNRTIGLESQFRKKYGHFKTKAAVDLAFQKQQHKKTDWIAYRKISASIAFRKIQLGLRHEKLSERSGVSFITPLATLHKFQGWTDQFLTTPSIGLVDNSISLEWQSRPWAIDIRHHQFTSDKHHIDIGKELNIDLIYQPTREHELKLRIADFNPATGQIIKTNDVRKFFLMYSYNI